MTFSTRSNLSFWPSRTWFWLLLILFALVWFVTLDYRHLIRTDEGRYAEIAREMFASGDWITPRYNDYKYFEKPVWQAWMTALTYTVFGVGDWQARLWTALSGFLSILAVAYTGFKVFSPRSGWLAALILASSPMWNIGGHFNTLDMGLSACLCWALCSLLLAQRAAATAREERLWMWACWGFMALAVMSKGLIGLVLPGMVLVVYTLIARDWALWKRLHLISGTVIFFAIAAPWHILVTLKNPEFPQFYFIHEHFERFTTTVHNRKGSYFYFVPLIIGGFLPWLMQLPAACKRAWQGFDHAEHGTAGFRADLLLLVWFVLIFLFFSKSNSKLPGYIIPVFPALALLAGHYLAAYPPKLGRWRAQVWGFTLLFAACCAVACAALAVGFEHLPLLNKFGQKFAEEPFLKPQYLAFTRWLAVAFGVGTVGLLVSLWLSYQDRAEAFTHSLTAFAITFFATFTVAGLGHETLGRSVSGADLAAQAKPHMQAGAPLYAVHGLDHTVPFYLRRPSMMVEHMDELEFGIKQEPEKWLPTLQAFVEKWPTLPQAYALMSHATYAQLQQKGLPMTVIARDERRVIVARRAPSATAPAPSKP